MTVTVRFDDGPLEGQQRELVAAHDGFVLPQHPIEQPLPRWSPWRLFGFRAMVIHRTLLYERNGGNVYRLRPGQIHAGERLLAMDAAPASQYERLVHLTR